jgi:hypothetical protein
MKFKRNLNYFAHIINLIIHFTKAEMFPSLNRRYLAVPPQKLGTFRSSYHYCFHPSRRQ